MGDLLEVDDDDLLGIRGVGGEKVRRKWRNIAAEAKIKQRRKF